MNAIARRTPNSFVGFDSLFNRMSESFKGDSFPPHNLVKDDEADTEFTLELAVAGFPRDKLNVVLDKCVLSVSGDRAESDSKDYLFRGISTRQFTKRFALAESIEVAGCRYEDGMLFIDLVRNVLEDEAVKYIDIK